MFGHIIGDYFLQPQKMAIHKSSNTLVCFVHVTIYTISVCAMLWNWNPVVALSIFLPHFIIDRWSLGEVWLRLIGGRTANGAMSETGVKREFAIAFYAPVYIIVDNGLHLLCIAGTIKFLLM
ncbi:MAG: DUF3307 domain-containing protein [Bacteroidetes bacterium]|nr:DUF3307 domain-containing protein [Bacteroidota bacterium]